MMDEDMIVDILTEGENDIHYQMQIQHMVSDLQDILLAYSRVTKQRYNDTLDNDRKVIYELMDMIDPLKAIVDEAASDYVSADYMFEKLYKVKNFVDYAYEYFKSTSGR